MTKEEMDLMSLSADFSLYREGFIRETYYKHNCDYKKTDMYLIFLYHKGIDYFNKGGVSSVD